MDTRNLSVKITAIARPRPRNSRPSDNFPLYDKHHNISHIHNSFRCYGNIPHACCDSSLNLRISFSCSFTCVEPPDGEWGVRHPNGSWSGLAGLMQRRVQYTAAFNSLTSVLFFYIQEADMVATAFTETFLRSQVMDFTSLCVFSDYKAFSYKKPSSRRANLAAFILPFDRIVWLCGVIVVCFVSCLFCWNGNRDSIFKSKLESCWFTIGAALQQGRSAWAI